ncbi:sensor histidine kinase [Salimicrobium flavidum]|uniref:histidine kinase n=1 Tax=Salimicrobium flavidum TaxID=570947 RepID=A0A1N7K053_9BACI|nr:sensor histidine kinase [Salimicrobium flavidum]SIS54962.1 Signal transduction histidine kinase [Salimicrobium flavidum]
MKLFIQEHMLLFLVQVIQFSGIAFLLYMDGYTNVSMLLYIFGLGFFFLFVYLIYQYVTRRRVYERLEKPLNHLDEAMEDSGQAPLAEALDLFMKRQYRVYQQSLMEAERQKEEHLMFMERWVHQMKTPLSVIELTSKEVDEPASSNIREETDRMKNGLQNVLYMARMRSVEDDFKVEPVALGEAVQAVVDENKRFFIRNRVYPKLETTNTFVETDKKWLEFILHQLMQNAVKYSAGKAQQIVISNYQVEDRYVLEVKDFGIGIPPEDQRRVYDPFFTGEHGRTYRESTGMGLYLVKEISDHLNHGIEMESVVGEGTTFRITFSGAQSLFSS